MRHPGDSPQHPVKTDSRHLIAIGEWADWLARTDADAAYHSCAPNSAFVKTRVVHTMASGSLSSVRNGGESWGEEALRKVRPPASVKHPSPRPSPRSCLTGRGRRRRYSLRCSRHERSQRLFPKATPARWLERDWFPVCTELVTLQGSSLKSTDASQFCQRLMQPRQINQTSSDLLQQSASQ